MTMAFDFSLHSLVLGLCGLFLLGSIIAHKLGLLPQAQCACVQSDYAKIVVQSGMTIDKRPVRILQTAPSGAQSAVYCDSPNELASHYTPFYDLAFYYNPATRNVLMLGGGGYCVPRHLLATRPYVQIEVVELDPEITQVARDYFFLEEHPNLTIHHEEARAFLERKALMDLDAQPYDAIFGDVFDANYAIPRPMTTIGCLRRIHSLLKPDGVFIMNIIGSLHGEQRDVFHGVYAGMARVFSRVKIFLASEPSDDAFIQNIMLVAFKSNEERQPSLASETITHLLSHEVTEPFYASTPPFTDALDPH